MSTAAEISLQLKASIEEACKALALEVTANLIETTPVATGFARANWIPSIGSPVTDIDGDHTSVSVSAQQEGIAQVLTYTIDAGDLFVSNNVPYIGMLDLGHSNQAPAGFVEAALQKAQDDVNARYASQNVSIDATSGIAAAGAQGLADFYSPLGEAA